MILAELTEHVYEDLGGCIDSIEYHGGTLLIRYSCDDWEVGEYRHTRRSFLLRCSGAAEWNVSVGSASQLDVTTEHPLLLKYHAPHTQLNYSSEPRSFAEAIGALHLAHANFYGAFAHYRREIHGPHQGASNGVLAAGPTPVIEALEQAVNGIMETYRRPQIAHRAKYCVLLFDHSLFIVCHEVTAFELGYGGSPYTYRS